MPLKIETTRRKTRNKADMPTEEERESARKKEKEAGLRTALFRLAHTQ